MPLRLGIVQINVADLRQAKGFYRDVLGCKVREPNGADAPFEIDLGKGATILVYQNPEKPVSTYANQRTTLAFYTQDLKRTIRAWEAKGVRFEKISWGDKDGIGECPYGRFIAFQDPFGNTHELLQPKP